MILKYSPLNKQSGKNRVIDEKNKKFDFI